MKTHIGSFLDLENLEKQIEEGFIARKKHPKADLFILNYTAMAQYTPGKMLDNEVKNCRGLIIDKDNQVVARPPKKFANLSEHTQVSVEEKAERERKGLPKRLAAPPLPLEEPFQVFAKVDGSAGILYTLNGENKIATRGSFTSEQALWATNYLQENFQGEFPSGETYFFEIIYPENRIVVNYDFSGLVLLAIIDNATGKDLPLPGVWPGRVVEKYEFSSFDEIAKLEKTDPQGFENSEGLVVLFESGVRVKVKWAEYIRLHGIMTNTSSKIVYEHLGVKALREDFSSKQVAFALGMEPKRALELMELEDPMLDLLDNVPDEFKTWLEETVAEFEKAILKETKEVEDLFQKLYDPTLSQKELAERFKETSKTQAAVLFKMLLKKPYADVLWRKQKPVYAKAFALKE